jgi:phenylacetate-CoA ligase
MSIYSAAYSNLILPAGDLLRRRSYARYRSLLSKSQWWSADELRAFQWKELRKLLERAFRSVPYYQRKFSEVGAELEDIRTWEDFARLPTLTRQDVNAFRAELCSTTFRGPLLPHATGGSSGVPTRFYRTYESYDWRTAARDRVYAWAGLIPGERAVYLWGAPVGQVSRKHLWREAASNFLQRRIVRNTFSQDDHLWTNIHAELSRYRPNTVVGYVSSLRAFADFLQQRNLHLPALRGVVAAAEPLFSDTRKQIASAFGAPVFNTYGSREFMSMAGECERQNGMHVNAENLLVETAQPGTPSPIYVTDLHNYGMPFIRYEIDDLGTMTSIPCGCGRGLPRLMSIEGRVLDALKTTEGRVVPGEFFPHLLKEIPEIRKYQVVQKTINRIEIVATISAPISEQSRALLQSEIGKAFGGQMDWEILPVEEIPRLVSGKHRVTVGLG